MKVFISRLAEEDLTGLYRYIASQNTEAAEDFKKRGRKSTISDHWTPHL